MAYRRTDRVLRRFAARRDAILAAAEAMAAEAGATAVQIAPVAERAGIAAGTVYRYFPSKAELVNELIARASAREIEAMREAAATAPGPLSAIAAAVAAFASRASANAKLSWMLIGETAEPETCSARLAFRRALIAELERLIVAATAAGLLPQEQAVTLLAAAVIGAIVQGLIDPLAPETESASLSRREAVQSLTLVALRALGVADARARGLVVQCGVPAVNRGAA